MKIVSSTPAGSASARGSVRLFKGTPMPAVGTQIASLRGRIYARRELLPQSEGDREQLEHEQAIAQYESEIARLEGAAQ